jgi:Flp pilus assembly protein TadB
LSYQHDRCDKNGNRSEMPAIIALILIAIVALTVLSFAVHILFSPWLLVAVGILLWIKFRPRRSHQ